MKNKTFIMGVINITPDSFSDGGMYNSLKKGLAHAEKLIEEGADILDIGGESTRPFSKPVPLEKELNRVVPLVKKIRKITDIPISIDTTKAPVAKAALESGASMINDISAMSFDSEMTEVAKNFNVPAILMHIKGTPENMQKNPQYKDLIDDIISYFLKKIAVAVEKGIKKEKLILDPGIGFGKTMEHNLVIINNLKQLKDEFGLPILIGTSRKTFIRKILEKDDLPNHPDVITGSVASVCAAILHGADIVRVHDVKETKAAVQIIDALKNF